MTWWWASSIACNRVLCGAASQPLCARIHEARPARWRSVACFCLDLVFAEYDHTGKVYAKWQRMRGNVPD